MNKTVLGVLSLIGYDVVSAAIYFLSAGRTDLPIAWVYFGGNLVFGLAFCVVLARKNPELIAERMKPGPGEQDRVTKLAGLLFLLLQLILAGLDVGRFHWTAPISFAAQVAAVVLAVVGYGLAAWAPTPIAFSLPPYDSNLIASKLSSTKGPTASYAIPGTPGCFCICRSVESRSVRGSPACLREPC